MTLYRTNFVSVHPLGENYVAFPPQGAGVRRTDFFVPVHIDDGRPMEDRKTFTFDRFPDENHMTAVFATPAGSTGFHVGRYGTWWPTDPAQRQMCYRGGFLTLEGVGNGA